MAEDGLASRSDVKRGTSEEESEYGHESDEWVQLTNLDR